MIEEELKTAIASIPDFPKPGILFRDITPVLLQPEFCRRLVIEIANGLTDQRVDAIAGIESRGFLFGMLIAQEMKLPFIPIRKANKLPRETIGVKYELEYGENELQIHRNDVQANMRIHVHDDLLATGGTAEAAAKLIMKCGANVDSFSFIIELQALKGRLILKDFSNLITSMVIY